MKIGELAQQAGISVHLIRQYEALGLLQAHRSPGGTRHYDAAARDRLLAIRSLLALELPLEGIRELASIRKRSVTGDQAGREVTRRIQALRDALGHKRQMLERAEAELEQLLGWVEGCFACPHPPRFPVCQTCPIGQRRPPGQALLVIWDPEESAAASPPGGGPAIPPPVRKPD